MIGRVVGNYRIVSELGQGGMGIVYRAEHVQLGRPVAIKMLLPALSNDAAIVQRFFNEARAASAIDHPGIVEIIDFGYAEGRAFLVMALLKGESLEHRLQRGPLPPLEGATIVAQMVAALAAAHARGIVHRDLKPDNIFLVPNELMPNGVQVKLLDFGIAKLAGERNAEFKTQTGMLIGTPAYMSPEQCMGKSDLDHRTDLYSVGCILFHVLCGRPPFVGEGGTGMMIAAHLRDPAPHPRSLVASVPEPLAAIVMRLLEKDPAARYQTATELRQALVHAGASSPTTLPGHPIDPVGQTVASMPPVVRTRDAYAQTTASTTGAGSAAQLVAAPTPQTRGRVLPFAIVGVVVAAIAGAGVFVMLTREPASGEQAAAPPPPARPAGSATTRVLVESELPCPAGQVRSDDTRGECCWPAQAWSSATRRCIGKPDCPAGTAVKGEQCLATVAAAPTHVKPDHRVDVPRISLGAKSYAPGAKIAITFAKPVHATAPDRMWITIAEATSPPSSYGTWEFVPDGATEVVLAAPATGGDYQVRLHGNYPRKPFDVRAIAAFHVGATTGSPVATVTPLGQQKFSLASRTFNAGGELVVSFPVAMHAPPGEKFWVTVVAAGVADTAWGRYVYVPDGARHVKLVVPPTAGDYEIRLHANYPKLTTHVVHRAQITVEGS
ncbi:MAG: serine/threonine-protein kinase [Kofleriaceae bacterium]